MSQSESLQSVADATEVATEVVEGDACDVEPSFGWNSYAELVNGRVAMLAVLGLLILECLTGQDMFTWLGLR